MEKALELYVRAQVEVAEFVKRLSQPREGQGLVEYVLIIALISIVIITTGVLMKDSIASVFTGITGQLNGAAGSMGGTTP